MTIVDTSSAAFFEAKYRKQADPWNFASNPYELHRYDTIIAALAHCRYKMAFEPGCSVGVLTERLASICDAVEAIDFSTTAVKRAQERCAFLPNVSIECASIADRLPLEAYDLVVLSEIGYYFTLEDWRETISQLVSPMASGATVLATHWLGTSADHRLSGDEVHEVIFANPFLCLQHSELSEVFRLDRWVRT